MKKGKILLICIVSSLLAGVLGYIIGINQSDEIRLNKQEKNIVGSYKTTTWNGKDAVFVLDKNKTCIHPSKGSKCEWKLSKENIVTLTVPNQEYKPTYIEMYLNEKLNKEDLNFLIQLITNNSGWGWNDTKGQFWGVNNVSYNEEKNLIKLDVDKDNIDTIITNLEELPTTKGLSITFSIKKIEKYIGGTFDTTENIEVRIVDKGLMLSGHFFEKLK